ncbi:acyl-CoA thioesterase [Parvularcula flava]|uniref:Acyl-CoA thioesterase n=2 Tax=Aquisalinus luteolus TaxID=1566827 RepID=A0ABX0HT75_9PROT|nr:acyl-CoA thioesterase [Aquisalinus luteolus]
MSATCTPRTDPMSRPEARLRDAYPLFRPIQTRWMDNDVYGHVNNVVYYSWFDTAVNGWLIEAAGLDIHEGNVIGLVIETQCNYFAPLAFPDRIEAGIATAHIGRSSVRYQIGLFAEGADKPAAQGHFVHVYVDRDGRRPVAALPEKMRAALEMIQRP